MSAFDSPGRLSLWVNYPRNLSADRIDKISHFGGGAITDLFLPVARTSADGDLTILNSTINDFTKVRGIIRPDGTKMKAQAWSIAGQNRTARDFAVAIDKAIDAVKPGVFLIDVEGNVVDQDLAGSMRTIYNYFRQPDINTGIVRRPTFIFAFNLAPHKGSFLGSDSDLGSVARLINNDPNWFVQAQTYWGNMEQVEQVATKDNLLYDDAGNTRIHKDKVTLMYGAGAPSLVAPGYQTSLPSSFYAKKVRNPSQISTPSFIFSDDLMDEVGLLNPTNW